jgi:hypothetical protein
MHAIFLNDFRKLLVADLYPIEKIRNASIREDKIHEIKASFSNHNAFLGCKCKALSYKLDLSFAIKTDLSLK